MSQADGQHHDHHDSHVAHHFESAGQQTASGKLGMWVFLATEILTFGGLFVMYSVYRANHPETFEYGHLLLETKWGAINTVILIASSFTMAWAVRTAQLGKTRATSILLVLTLFGGFGFMGIKYVEYSHKFHMGTGPGNYFDIAKYDDYYTAHLHDYGHHDEHHEEDDHASPEPHPVAEADHHDEPVVRLAAAIAPPQDPSFRTNLSGPVAAPAGLLADIKGPQKPAFGWPQHRLPTPAEALKARNFVDIYFSMTALHGLHVIIGMSLIGWVLIRNLKGRITPKTFLPVDLVGLFWHLVDLIWIFLFPLLYLIHT